MSDDRIGPGKYVSFTYRISDDAGNVLEHNDLPVSYIHGGPTEIIGDVDQALVGKGPGDELDVQVPPEKAFGPHDPNLTFTDDLENVPLQFRQVGAEVQMQNEAGEVKSFYVTHIEDGRLTVDGNHPMAGKTLVVHVKVMEVRTPTADDLARLQQQALH